LIISLSLKKINHEKNQVLWKMYHFDFLQDKIDLLQSFFIKEDINFSNVSFFLKKRQKDKLPFHFL